MSRHALRAIIGVVLVAVSACSVSEAAQPSNQTATTAVSAAEPSTDATDASDVIAAPEFTGQTITGATVRGTDLWQSGPVVMIFFASWCGVCAENQAEWNDLAAQYAGRATVVGVVPDERADELSQYLAAHPVSYQVISDPDKAIWRSFGVTEPPLVALVGRGGAPLQGWPGGDASADLIASLNDAVQR
jgi:peroxiredoxin